jgi:hypothetical protein
MPLGNSAEYSAMGGGQNDSMGLKVIAGLRQKQ